MTMPVTCLATSRLNDGARDASVTVDVELPAAVVTTTGTAPLVPSSGTCGLICVGLTNQRQAGFPSIATVALPEKVPVPGYYQGRDSRFQSSQIFRIAGPLRKSWRLVTDSSGPA